MFVGDVWMDCTKGLYVDIMYSPLAANVDDI